MRNSGHVAHCQPGAIILDAEAAAALAAHFRRTPLPDDPRLRLIVWDIQRMSFTGPVSRDETVLNPFIGRNSITVAEAARHLGITPGGVRRRIYRNQLPAAFNGHRWHIEPKHLEGNGHGSSNQATKRGRNPDAATHAGASIRKR